MRQRKYFRREGGREGGREAPQQTWMKRCRALNLDRGGRHRTRVEGERERERAAQGTKRSGK